MAVATAKGFGKLNVAFFKGCIVDIPLAGTEGFRVVPRLYGENVDDQQTNPPEIVIVEHFRAYLTAEIKSRLVFKFSDVQKFYTNVNFSSFYST